MRLEISEYAAAGWNDTQIAMAIGCSVWTVRKWRRRWRKLGPVGFTSQMGRPVTGPVSTFPHELKAAILHLRLKQDIGTEPLANPGFWLPVMLR